MHTIVVDMPRFRSAAELQEFYDQQLAEAEKEGEVVTLYTEILYSVSMIGTHEPSGRCLVIIIRDRI